MPTEFLLNTGQMYLDGVMYELGRNQEPSQLMLFVGDSRARTSATQESVPVLTEIAVDYSLKSSASLARWNPDSLSWRTSQLCLAGEWEEFSGSWPRSGLIQNGIAYQLPSLVPRTSGTGCFYWPTPRANESTETWEAIQKRKKRTGNAQINLTALVKLWPTPTSRMYKDNGKSPSELNRNSETLATKAGGQLNPQWVEWLMGFPLGWTDLSA